MRAFYQGNAIAALSLVDFLPAFGFGVYPFGYGIMTLMHAATVFGSTRYRLIELTPEFTAAQILKSLGEGVVVLDSQGVTRLVNETGARMLGHRPLDIVDQPFRNISPGPLLSLVDLPLEDARVSEIQFHTSNSRNDFTVRPSGSTIRDHMFDPFYTTKFAGRGLGLANVMGIVQSHDGMIKVASTVGFGTSVTIALPAAKSSVRSVDENSVALPRSGSGIALVVDDESEVRHAVAQMLVRLGFETIEAVDGKEAVVRFRDRKDDVAIILLDVTMPEMDGAEALREIRKFSNDVPVILMSGYAENTMELPSDHNTWFLSKPFRISMLTEKLRDALPSLGQGERLPAGKIPPSRECPQGPAGAKPNTMRRLEPAKTQIACRIRV